MDDQNNVHFTGEPVQVEIAYQDVKKDSPTASDVHIDVPLGSSKKKGKPMATKSKADMEEMMEDPEEEATETPDEEDKEKQQETLKKLYERLAGASTLSDRLSKLFEGFAKKSKQSAKDESMEDPAEEATETPDEEAAEDVKTKAKLKKYRHLARAHRS